jgi:hypothetical protein
LRRAYFVCCRGLVVVEELRDGVVAGGVVDILRFNVRGGWPVHDANDFQP